MNAGTPHAVWDSKHPRDIRRSVIKAKIMTGCYMLQTTQTLFGGKETVCPLCLSVPEARVHLITECPMLQDIRKPLMIQIQSKIPTPLYASKIIFTNPELVTQLVLDPSHVNIKKVVQLTEEDLAGIEATARLLCYRLHYRRAKYLGYRH